MDTKNLKPDVGGGEKKGKKKNPNPNKDQQ